MTIKCPYCGAEFDPYDYALEYKDGDFLDDGTYMVTSGVYCPQCDKSVDVQEIFTLDHIRARKASL